MRVCSPLLYFDRLDYNWRFYVNDNGELVYSIMYEEDKWTKESKIDSEVIDLTACIDGEHRLYIVYSIKGGRLKYCIWEDNQWIIKILYTFEKPGYQIRGLNVSIIGRFMHIFFIAKNDSKKNQFALMHFCFNSEENIISNIYNICFVQEAYSNYQTEVFKDGSLNLLLIYKQESEIAIKIARYKDGKWGIQRRLYGIKGSNINFCTLQHNNKIHILNLSLENSVYCLEHVLIEGDGKMKSNKINESSIEFKNHLLLEVNGVLWAMWSEEEKIFTSSYRGRWSEPILCGRQINEVILLYKYLSFNDKYRNLKSKYVLATMPPEIRLVLPEIKNIEDTKYALENGEKDILNPSEDYEERNENIDEEFLLLKKTNKNLEKRVIDLQLQLQQKQRIISESDENFSKLVSSTKKAEEKLNLITEVYQVSTRELEEIKKQKISRDNVEAELKIKMEKLLSEKERLKMDLEEIKNQKIASNNLVAELKNKCKDLTSENEQIKIELKYESNKGFIDRLLKKKLDR